MGEHYVSVRYLISWGTETGESGEHYVSVPYLISWGTETGELGQHYVSVWDLIEPGPFCGRILHFFLPQPDPTLLYKKQIFKYR